MFHPNTVWDATVSESGDLLTACGDGVLRVFSNNPELWLSKEDIEQYTNFCLVEGNKNQEEQIKDSGLSVKQLPSIDYINKNKGKEGELRAFNNNGKGECWTFKNGKWEKVGDVIGGEEKDNNQSNIDVGTYNKGISLAPKYYSGDKFFQAGTYDFIFDVEVKGITTKLPFNFDGNKLLAAEKFCKREDLHMMNKEDIIKFLKENASVKPNYNKSNKSEVFVNHFANSKLDKVKLPIVSSEIHLFLNNKY